MNFIGKLLSITKDWKSGEYNITFSFGDESALNGAEILQTCEKLNISAKPYRKKRSLNANDLMWKCIGEIAAALRADKWDIYLKMLKRYGKYTHICVKPKAVEAVRAQWRESEVVGEVKVNGQKAYQMLCYFGSSTYDTKEFSVLLDGIISEMKELGLELPMPKEMQRALELWEKVQGK